MPPAPSTSEAEPPALGPILVYLARDPSLALAAAMVRHPQASGVLVAAPAVGFSSPSAEHLSFHFPGWIKIPPMEREPASALLDLVLLRRARALLLLAVFPDSPSSQSTKTAFASLVSLLRSRAALQQLPVSLQIFVELEHTRSSGPPEAAARALVPAGPLFAVHASSAGLSWVSRSRLYLILEPR